MTNNVVDFLEAYIIKYRGEMRLPKHQKVLSYWEWVINKEIYN